MPNIAYVEQDAYATVSNIQPEPVSWGLPRISKRTQLSFDAGVESYAYPDSAGEGVRVYVVDTGIFVGHYEFEGRAEFGVTFTNDGVNDGNGHGT